jgi:NADH-quinone oxidoreductase subunit N
VDYYDPMTVGTLKGVFQLVLPEAVLVLAACVLFLGASVRKPCRHVLGAIALVGLAAAAVALAFARQYTLPPSAATVSPIWPDALTFLVRVIALAGGAALVLMTWDDVPDAFAGEYHGCLLLITAGTALTAAAGELITLFLALELISIPTYVLLYLPRADRPAQEAAVKYFLLSVFSSALLLFGFSYLYGLTGTTNLAAILDALTAPETLVARAGDGSGRDVLTPTGQMALAALVLVVAGLGFRITAVPFHFYAPDVYEGTATGNAALLAFVPKVAGFVALVRVFGYAGQAAAGAGITLGMQVPLLFWILAAITMTLGNVLALWQDNLRRILAYSSVAHAGYMLIGLTVVPNLMDRTEAVGGVPAVLFYLVAYGAMTLGAFGVIALLSTSGRSVDRVDDLAGLGRSHPALALLMALFLFSLIGLPLTAGFMGKFLLFFGALVNPTAEAGRLFRILALIGAINAAIGAYYYLRIVGVMYLRGALRPLGSPRSRAGWITVAACAVVTLWLGVYPAPMVRWAKDATTPTATPNAMAQR